MKINRFLWVILSSTVAFAQTDSPLKVGYATHLDIGDTVFNISNSGVNSSPTQNGNLCINAYAFSPDEQLISCCSCLVTPDGLVSLSAQNDLISNTLTPSRPTSIVVALVATAGTNAASCNASTPGVGTNTPVNGMDAWVAKTVPWVVNAGIIMPVPPSSSSCATPCNGAGQCPAQQVCFGKNVATGAAGCCFVPVALNSETPLAPKTLSPAELTRITSFCGFIQANGSGFGICKACRLGALGATKQ